MDDALHGDKHDRVLEAIERDPVQRARLRKADAAAKIAERDLDDLSHDTLALTMGHKWDDARHVALWGQWLFWTGSRWLSDECLLHLTRTREFLRTHGGDLIRSAMGRNSEKAVEQARAAAKQLRSAPTVASVVGLARSNPEQVATVAQWDSDKLLLGTPHGTVDLRDGSLRAASPLDYITKGTAVAPAAMGVEPKLWLQFLERVTGGNSELKAYLQRVAGYCLTGAVSEHALFFLYGTGSNGKSVFVNSLRGLALDYAVTIATDMLMVSAADRHPTEVARLRGARLVIGNEVEVGRTWAESKIKMLTGGDRLQGRFMRQDIFEFDPQFKLVLVGNNKPSLRGVDEAIRRRLHLIPFTVTIPEAERNRHLEQDLREEWPAILRWMIDGCAMWREFGLNPPDTVRAATANYLEGEDAFELWRQDCTDPNPRGWESSSDLWTSWKRWAEGAGEFVGKQRSFSDRLEERGFTPHRQPGSGRRGFYGADIRRSDYTEEGRYGG